MAYQPFERGVMLWDGADLPSIYVGLGASEDWAHYVDRFEEGDPERDPDLVPPEGLLQPVRGFGRIWREEEGIRPALGWALASEFGFAGTWQPFESGEILADPDGRVWVFYAQDPPRWEVLQR